jgi:hypothetical protein
LGTTVRWGRLGADRKPVCACAARGNGGAEFLMVCVMEIAASLRLVQ